MTASNRLQGPMLLLHILCHPNNRLLRRAIEIRDHSATTAKLVFCNSDLDKSITVCKTGSEGFLPNLFRFGKSIYVHKVYVYEMYAHDVHAREVHAHEVHAVRYMLIRCTPVRCTFTKYTPMRCTPMRYMHMRNTPMRYSSMRYSLALRELRMEHRNKGL